MTRFGKRFATNIVTAWLTRMGLSIWPGSGRWRNHRSSIILHGWTWKRISHREPEVRLCGLDIQLCYLLYVDLRVCIWQCRPVAKTYYCQRLLWDIFELATWPLGWGCCQLTCSNENQVSERNDTTTTMEATGTADTIQLPRGLSLALTGFKKKKRIGLYLFVGFSRGLWRGWNLLCIPSLQAAWSWWLLCISSIISSVGTSCREIAGRQRRVLMMKIISGGYVK